MRIVSSECALSTDWLFILFAVTLKFLTMSLTKLIRLLWLSWLFSDHGKEGFIDWELLNRIGFANLAHLETIEASNNPIV